MGAIPAQRAYDQIVARINKQGSDYCAWYAGIAADWQRRLFEHHRVPRNDPSWITRECFSANLAREVEEALLELGCDGGRDAGGDDTVHVYAYLKSAQTTP